MRHGKMKRKKMDMLGRSAHWIVLLNRQYKTHCQKACGGMNDRGAIFMRLPSNLLPPPFFQLYSSDPIFSPCFPHKFRMDFS
jgi:hypothetical protein